MDRSRQSLGRPMVGRTRRAVMWAAGLALIGWLVATAVSQLLNFTGYGIGLPVPPTFPFDILAVLVLFGLVVAHTGRVWPLVTVVLLGCVVELQRPDTPGDPSNRVGLALLIVVAIAALAYRAERRRAEAPPRVEW